MFYPNIANDLFCISKESRFACKSAYLDLQKKKKCVCVLLRVKIKMKSYNKVCRRARKKEVLWCRFSL